MNKYEDALDWLIYRCMEPNDDYEGAAYEQVPYIAKRNGMNPKQLREQFRQRIEEGCCYNCPLSYIDIDNDCDVSCVLHCIYDECPLETEEQQ